jgi:hypothetical protein
MSCFLLKKLGGRWVFEGQNWSWYVESASISLRGSLEEGKVRTITKVVLLNLLGLLALGSRQGDIIVRRGGTIGRCGITSSSSVVASRQGQTDARLESTM